MVQYRYWHAHYYDVTIAKSRPLPYESNCWLLCSWIVLVFVLLYLNNYSLLISVNIWFHIPDKSISTLDFILSRCTLITSIKPCTCIDLIKRLYLLNVSCIMREKSVPMHPHSAYSCNRTLIEPCKERIQI